MIEKERLACIMQNEKFLKNSEATRFRAGAEQAEVARKGGKASGEKRRRRRTVAEAVREACEKSIKDVPGLEKVAKKFGLSDSDDVLSVVVQSVFLNEIKKGDFKSLKDLTDILGESPDLADDEKKKNLLAAIEKAVNGE